MDGEEMDVGREVERALAADDLGRAEELLGAELERNPDDHWCWARLAAVRYDQRRYGEALECSERALALAPRCPLSLWERAGALDMLGRSAEAIVVWKGLLARGVERLAHGRCGEGKRWTESLLNDCRYRIAKAALELGDRRTAARCIREHLRRRRAGLYSCATRAEALKLQRRIGMEAGR